MQTIREIILDTETTGLSPKDGHRIIEIGALEMINKVLTGNNFHTYINPKRNIPMEAYRVHGISEEFLADKPLFHDISKEFLEFIQDAKLVIHNAQFDVRFLNHELNLLAMPLIELKEVIDTLAMAKTQFPGARNNLDALCDRFRIDKSSRQKYHGALRDSELLAEVYIELTGGRQNKFEISNEEKMIFIENVTYKAIDNNAIVEPTELELQKHQELLNKFL